MAGHFSAELPVPKVKTAILAVRGGRNDISSQRQCYWAYTSSRSPASGRRVLRGRRINRGPRGVAAQPHPATVDEVGDRRQDFLTAWMTSSSVGYRVLAMAKVSSPRWSRVVGLHITGQLWGEQAACQRSQQARARRLTGEEGAPSLDAAAASAPPLGPSRMCQ
jgi:hypothetical protein